MWHHEEVELARELGRRAIDVTGDSRETTYLFQRLSVALQKGNKGGLVFEHAHSRPACLKPLIFFLVPMMSAHSFKSRAINNRNNKMFHIYSNIIGHGSQLLVVV